MRTTVFALSRNAADVTHLSDDLTGCLLGPIGSKIEYDKFVRHELSPRRL